MTENGNFFFANNPKETKEWYANNLGLEIDDHGSAFEFRNANRPDEINYSIIHLDLNGNIAVRLVYHKSLYKLMPNTL